MSERVRLVAAAAPRAAEVALRDVRVDEPELALDLRSVTPRSASPVGARERNSRSARQPAEPQDRLRLRGALVDEVSAPSSVSTEAATEPGYSRS